MSNTSDDRFVTMPASASDADLLRRFEPICHLTKGEQFYPMDVESYVRECSLWEHTPEGGEAVLVRQGELSLEELVKPRPAPFRTVHFLRFIETLSLTEAAQALAAQARLRYRLRNFFHAGLGRLARGGFLPRLADAAFSLSFLLRGKVSAATAATAELAYNRMRRSEKRNVYYARLVRQNGWVILQYWLFYCYNSWRSGFHGVNDHESDWETVAVYLYEKDGLLHPEWAAYASHDYKGDDLRRRWDDADELTVEDGHPVVYVGAGSHAAYFRPGEYQAEVNLPLPSWLTGVVRAWNRFWTEVLDQPPANPFRIPFVDYARGDGLRIGPGDWSPEFVDESTPWLSQYRGLWGLYARDPISGENAPAGPMYNRDGTPRAAWYDPLGFVGLDKVPPPPQALKLLEAECAQITARQNELGKLIPDKNNKLQALGVKLRGMEESPHLAKQYAALEKQINSLAEEVKGLRREHSENSALLQGLAYRLDGLRSGLTGDPRSHIRHLAAPVETVEARFSNAAETWAAISLSLMLFAIAGLVFFVPNYLWAGLAVIFVLFVVLESILRGAFVPTVARISVVLALLAAFILFFHFWKYVIVGVLVAMGVYLLFERLRELTS
ncbi:MAG: hypothetical protein AB1531_02495 [Chloroflexota bacterium]